ncbi:unnamed protein product [Prorocentrum cordatum]|uniref:Calmodulin n=1 Tax=Prorocentrum cordatum TaxID=2364126 RepID=A0ABN9Y671_9DINO|nr:unnamed protein product [Polarella glacialis]
MAPTDADGASPRDAGPARRGPSPRSAAPCEGVAKYPPCWKHAPTLLDEEGPPPPSGQDASLLEAVERHPFQAQCALVLSVTDLGEGWAGTWKVGAADYDKLKSEMFCEIDGSAQKNGNISWEDFEAYCEEHTEEILKGPSLFHGMLHESSRHKAFETFDGDGHAGLSRAEFDAFVRSLQGQHLQHLLRRAHLQGRAFWGRRAGARGAEVRSERGLEVVRAVVDAAALQEADGSARPTGRLLLGRDADIELADGGVCLGVFALGWWEDFKYYSANNHPLHGILMCDPGHPLDWKERLMMEISTLCYTWFVMQTATQLSDAADAITWGPEGKALCSVLFTTITGMVWWYALFMLFTVPCTDVDESAESASKVAKMKTIRRSCEAVGYFLVLSAVLMATWSLWVHTDYVARPVLLGRLKAYAISWLLMFFLQFNPVVAFGNSDPAQKPTLIDKLAAIIGIGQWRIEKMTFQYLCIRGLGDLDNGKAPGDAEFHNMTDRSCLPRGCCYRRVGR